MGDIGARMSFGWSERRSVAVGGGCLAVPGFSAVRFGGCFFTMSAIAARATGSQQQSERGRRRSQTH
jgi:hypothetical protein